jgi:pimeloyl-ACP methyl ester carboxylesterase
MSITPTGFPAFKSAESQARYLAAYDAVLRGWPKPFDEREIATRLGPTHVVACGPAEAPPLVLLPSFAATATVWAPNVAGLSEHFCVYALDVVGQPGKSQATRRIRSRRDYAQWLTDVLDGLGVARASIVGCSFGGFLALNQAVETPERVERVVMISPVGAFASQSLRLTYVMRIRTPLFRIIRRLRGDKRAPSMADLRANPPRPDPRAAAWYALMSVTMSEAAKVSIISPAVFSRAQLRAIRARCLLLIGERESLYDPEAMLTLAKRRMPALEGAVVLAADHIAALAQPEEVNARVVAFLSDAPRP